MTVVLRTDKSPHELHPVHFRHLQIREHDVNAGFTPIEDQKCILRSFKTKYFIAEKRKLARQHLEYKRFVVDDNDLASLR